MTNLPAVTLYSMPWGYTCKTGERFGKVGYGKTPEEALAWWQARSGQVPGEVFGGIRVSKKKATRLQSTIRAYI